MYSIAHSEVVEGESKLNLNSYLNVTLIQGGAKRTHVFEMGSSMPAISLFGVTSNQKSTFENLVQSMI